MPVALRTRSEVPPEHTWAVESVYATADEWEAAFAACEAEISALARFHGHLTDSAATLAEWLTASTALAAAVDRVFVYAAMRFDVDKADQVATGLLGRAQGLYARCRAALAFAEPELLAAGPASLDALLAAEPGLPLYRHYLDNLLRQRDHVRSGEVESLLALAGEPLSTPANAYGALMDSDLAFAPACGSTGGERPVTPGTIGELLRSDDREMRRSAYESYADGFLSVKNTMAALLSGSIKAAVFQARARGYASVLEASLAANNLPPAVFDNVIDACVRHLPIWHRYWEVRRRALGLETLAPSDVFAPLTPAGPEVPYERAAEWICAGMAPLGPEYVAAMRRGLLEERWVDREPNQGKDGGAYSIPVYGIRPFILMNYADGLESLSTLAHELGHSMHAYLTQQHQPYIYNDNSLFTAEVASNFNQALVRAHLLRRSDERAFQIAVVEEAMQNFHRYLFLMPILAQFERDSYAQVERGQALTADDMSARLAALFQRGYGPAVTLHPAREGITWAQFSHLYVSFYVYQYASGIAAANALADAILAGEAGAAERYLDFLRAGSSRYPLDALQRAGIDMTSPEPMDRAFGVLDGFVTRLEQLV